MHSIEMMSRNGNFCDKSNRYYISNFEELWVDIFDFPLVVVNDFV